VPCQFLQHARALPAAAAANSDAVSGSVPSELRVLLVEDDDLNFLVMQSSLAMGFSQAHGTAVKVQHSRTAEEALKLIGDSNECGFDLIVADQHMEMAGGVMKGSELVAVLSARRKGVWRDLAMPPVLAIASGDMGDTEAMSSHEWRGGACGADIFWCKPIPRSSQLVADIVPHLFKNRKSGQPQPQQPQQPQIQRAAEATV